MPQALQDNPNALPIQPGRSLIKPARRVLFIVGGIVGILELVQHFVLYDFEINLYPVGEVVVYFLALPTIGWILLSYLERSERKRMQSTQTLEQHTELSRALGRASEWEDVLRASVEFPHLALPVRKPEPAREP